MSFTEKENLKPGLLTLLDVSLKTELETRETTPSSPPLAPIINLFPAAADTHPDEEVPELSDFTYGPQLMDIVGNLYDDGYISLADDMQEFFDQIGQKGIDKLEGLLPILLEIYRPPDASRPYIQQPLPM